MKKILFSVLFVFSTGVLVAQVPRQIVVEHFTNSKCSVCASRNPGFFTNLSNHPDVLHMAVHPSSPYSDCYLNNLNKNENDGRTNYYGVYGSTPRFVIQGEVQPSSLNASNGSIFTPFENKTTEAELRIEQQKFGSDSIRSRVIVKTVAAHSYGNLRLFVAFLEDTVAYAAPNGENFHYNVFRMAGSAIEGDVIQLPSSIGDSVYFDYSTDLISEWSRDRMFTLAVLQEEGSKNVVQADQAPSDPTNNPVGIASNSIKGFELFPNPAKDFIIIHSSSPIEEIRLMNVLGEVVQSAAVDKDFEFNLRLENLESGVYFLQVLGTNSSQIKRIIIR